MVFSKKLLLFTEHTTVSSLDSKEALTNIDKVYMDYVTSNLHASMCEKNKLRVYRELKEVFECKKYLYGVPDMGSKLLFRFRSGTHGLNEELGRHITRNVSKACVFCNCDCESVEHVLWECPAYSNNRSVFRSVFINSLSKILCSDFHLMSAFEKTRYIFDQSVWECNGHFDHWFSNIKSFLCGIWNLRREKLYPEDFSMNTASNSSVERRVVNGRNAMAKRSWVSTEHTIIYYLASLTKNFCMCWSVCIIKLTIFSKYGMICYCTITSGFSHYAMQISFVKKFIYRQWKAVLKQITLSLMIVLLEIINISAGSLKL